MASAMGCLKNDANYNISTSLPLSPMLLEGENYYRIILCHFISLGAEQGSSYFTSPQRSTDLP